MSINYNDLKNGNVTASTISNALDNLRLTGALGPASTAISDTFWGINHRQTPNSVPINRDYHGLTFFTRPRMNLTTANLQQDRIFAPLLNNNDLTIPRAIRALLDSDANNTTYHDDHSSQLVDDYQMFIPILTNQLMSISGWPDLMAPTYSSKAGGYQESFSIVDGVVENYTTFDMTATFRNLIGDPITAMFFYWIFYASKVYRGILVPYPDALIENEVDYQTRIYRLVLDPSRRFVQKIAACGAAFPLDVPIGNAFNYDSDTGPINRANDQITIRFRCMGAMYQDDILIKEFNQAVVLQNNNMDDGPDNADLDAIRNQYYTQLDPVYTPLFNNMGYPRIDPNTYELQWWIDKDRYDNTVGALQASDPSYLPSSTIVKTSP